MRFLLPLSLVLLAACSATPRPASPSLPTESVAVSIDPSHPGRERIGRLLYRGGVELRSADKRVGGYSSLKRRNGRLYAITDTGDWAIIDPIERSGRLVGATVAEMGDLHGLDGEILDGTETGDAESLAPLGDGWLVSFEHQHKILRYRSLAGPSQASGLDPRQLFGDLPVNNGIETLATRGDRIFLCAERLPSESAPNCLILGPNGRESVAIPAPQGGIDPNTAFPVDADWASDGTLYILMRSWSGGNDNRAAIVQRSPNGALQTLATFVKPLATDNYEGLALREQDGRTFLYMISDDNFHVYDHPNQPETWQRTLLMKFELAR